MTRRQLRRQALVTLLGVLCLVVLTAHPFAYRFSRAHQTARLSTVVSERDALSKQYGCSNRGLGKGVIPGGALVTRDGHTVHTSFDEGWAVYLHGGPGVLAEVCAR